MVRTPPQTLRDAQKDYFGIATLVTHCTQLIICSKAPHVDCAPLKGNGFSTLTFLVCCQIRETFSVGHELKSLLQSKSNAYHMGNLVSKNQWPEFHHNPHDRKYPPPQVVLWSLHIHCNNQAPYTYMQMYAHNSSVSKIFSLKHKSL